MIYLVNLCCHCYQAPCPKLVSKISLFIQIQSINFYQEPKLLNSLSNDVISAASKASLEYALNASLYEKLLRSLEICLQLF